MKYKKFYSSALILFGLLALAFSLNGSTLKEETNYNLRNSMSNDTIPGDTTYLDNITNENIYPPKDLSSSFNERGFYKSNSFSANGEEIVNDFNGNLCYSIPLASGKGEGDISYNLSINYNGNVNYQIICGNSTDLNWTFTQLHTYNFSAPGWIYSLNGLAVQMINFESNTFSRSNYGEDVIGRNVRLLPSGYNITDQFKTPTSDNKDRITIMLGDGSTETLENSQIDQPYIGTYKSTSKNSYIKAEVEYISPNGNGAGDCRRMYLMKGDGLTYIYTEYLLTYNDRGTNVAPWFKATTFLLTSIKDRFGHVENLSYNNSSNSGIGRPWLSSCPGAYFNYIADGMGSYRGIKVTVRGENNYIFYTDQFSTAAGDEHRPLLNEILNPSGERMVFNYEPYERIGTGLYDKNGGDNMSIKFSNDGKLYRLSQFQNYDGGKKTYHYSGPNVLQLNYKFYVPEAGAHSNISNYKGQGRDLFFSNMIDTITQSDNNVNINKVVYNYAYNYFRDTNNVWQYPVNENDEYYSYKTITSLNNDNINNSPSKFVSSKLYRNYRIKAISTGELMDFTGTTKLEEEKFYQNDETNEYKKMNYYYYKGSPQNMYDIFPGTFLDSVRIENGNGAERKWRYEYEGGTNNTPLTMKKETDPLDRVTTTYFQTYERDTLRVFKDGAYRWEGQDYDTVKLYLIHQPYLITISKNNNVLQKKEITYYNPNDVTWQTIVSGYPGQVFEEKDLNPQTNDELRKITYKYNSRDTTGRYMTPNWAFANHNEGNVKEIIDANGNISKYYYDVISRSEDELYGTSGSQEDDMNNPQKFTYHKLKDNGSDVIERTNWRDYRLPSRIDNYVDGNRYLSHYQQYNEIGNPTMVVNENNYLSQAKYDRYYRLTSLTLPYDFNDSLPDTTITVTRHAVPFSKDMYSIAWGQRNEISPANSVLSPDADGAWSMSIDYHYTLGDPDNPNDRKINALTMFDKTILNNGINIIDSAFLLVSPYFLFAKHNNDAIDYNFIVHPLNVLSGSGQTMQYSEGNGTQNFGNLNVDTSSSCFGIPNSWEYLTKYRNNSRRLDIANMLRSNLDSSSGSLNFQGMKFSITSEENLMSGTFDCLMNQYCCSSLLFTYLWSSDLLPSIQIYGKTYVYDTVKTINYKNGSLSYSYDDANNKVTVQSKIDKSGTYNRSKKVENYFDGFGNLKQSKIYTSVDSSNIYATDYNYLYQKAKSTDAMGNSTKFSYDKYGSLAKTENADASANYVSNTYQSALSTTFYNISGGFVNKQQYTDETGRKFEKYFDAVGNLLREVKYIVYDNTTPDNPPDIDSTGAQLDSFGDIALTTDYRYDDLYRVVEVKTPSNKRIYYSYDILGRQSSRTTPDAGLTKSIYDKNNNLLYSQDANQYARGANIYSFRNYDGLNRLLSLGETQIGNINPSFDNLNSGNQYDFVGTESQMLTVNVYDSLIYSSSNVFTNIPSDYYVSGKSNNTKGALVATAYRTNISDSWGYKFYKYDARGRVIKMWHYINGLGWKAMSYNYNSQNQVSYLNYNPSGSDGKLYKYSYDVADRLSDVSIYSGSNIPTEEDYPGEYFSFASYDYNKNSQLLNYRFNNNSNEYRYNYNERNWISSFGKTTSPSDFTYFLTYLANGNIRQSMHTGDYVSQLQDNSTLNYTYVYDKSNRLLKANKDSASITNSFDATMSYDYDGNLLTLKRYGSTENLVDNFTYSYYINTNKISKVNGQDAQYSYDANGNLTGDNRDADNSKNHMIYDCRNLLKEMQLIKNNGDAPPQIYQLKFDYDEAGNRIRKREYLYQGQDQTPIFQEDNGTTSLGTGDNPPQTWMPVVDEYYVRDVSGKEIAVYHSNDLDHWNVCGTDNVGKINANGDKFFYIKDHLGSIRVVLNSDNNIVSAQDYDCWGYPLENRNFKSEDINYKFTGKQRDAETGYDYFGARYYDARIANWGSGEPLLEKRLSWSPYNYTRRNPVSNVDLDGNIDVPKSYEENYKNLYNYLKYDLENVIMNNKSTVEAFKSETEISKQKLREFVHFGDGPKFEITDLGYGNSNEKREGHWKSGYEKHADDGFLGPFNFKDGTIQMDEKLAKDCEAILEQAQGNEKDYSARVVKRYLKHFFTHEVGHGAIEETGKKVEGETGYRLEKKAYGFVANYVNGKFQKGQIEESIFNK